MNTALDLTLETLAHTPNSAADQLLSLAIVESPSIRRQGIRALLSRKNRFGAQQIMRMWGELTDDELRAVQEFPSVMRPAVDEALRGKIGSEEWLTALDILRMLSLSESLPTLIDLLESSGSTEHRNLMLTAVLQLGSTLGDAGRQGRDQASIRLPIVNRLAESVRRVDYHRCQGLCEAFLVTSVWGDRELRLLLQEDYVCARRLSEALESSSLPGVAQLVAGYVRRRNIPEVVRHAIESRRDTPFRDSLFAAVGEQPTRTTLKNLASFRPLESLLEGPALVAATKPANYSGLLYAHTYNCGDAITQLSVILEVLARGHRSTDLAIVATLARCTEIPDEEWLKAALLVTSADVSAVNSNPLASILWRMVQMLDHPDPSVVEALRDVLKSLQVESLLKNIESIPPTSFQRFGGMVRKIDPRTVEIIRDELRCPVMERRSRAIMVAAACDVVSDVESLLVHAAIHDHRETRLVAIQTLEMGTSDESYEVLQRIASGPIGALRDAAILSLENRNVPSLIASGSGE